MKTIIKKLIALIITLFIVSLLAFVAFSIIPGDPTTRMLGTEATPEAVAALRAQLGLDQPVLIRYFNWVTSFIRGDFGSSYTYGLSVSEMLSDKLPITAMLVFLSFIITVIFSIPLGILAGNVRNSVIDKLVIAVDQVVMSVPAFFIGVLICYIFGLILKLFVPGNFVSPQTSMSGCLLYLLFPAFAIAIPRIAMTVKMLRGSILNEMGQDYVRTALSRGNTRATALRNHVLRNALIPVITFLAISMAEIVTSSIIIEQVFTVPGIGRLLLASINNRDFPVVQAIVVMLAAWIVTVNFVADLLNQLVDPRMRLR